MSELNGISSCTGKSTRAKLSSISVTVAAGHGSGKSLADEQQTSILKFSTAQHQHGHGSLINKRTVPSVDTNNQRKLDILHLINLIKCDKQRNHFTHKQTQMWPLIYTSEGA